MHVLIIPSWYPCHPADVTGVFFRDQALALLNYGHKVGVISPQTVSVRTLVKRKKKISFPYKEVDAGVPTYRRKFLAALPRVPYGNFWLFRRVARQLMRDYVQEHGRPDIIHAHSAMMGGAAAIHLGKEWQVPVVLTEHSSAFARGMLLPWQLKLAAATAKLSQSRVSVSPALGTLLGNKIGPQGNSWKWIPNVVADRFEKPVRLPTSGRTLRFLSLALMSENKGQKDLLQAFRQVVDSGLSAELWLAGDGPTRKELERLASQLDVNDQVSFLGMIPPEKVPALLSQADIMVISSHYETFGVVAAEALMAGLPVIATRCGGPECIVGQGDGVLVSPRHPGELGGAMLSVAERLSSFVPEDIACRAKARFSGPAVAAQLTREYEKVLAGHRATRV